MDKGTLRRRVLAALAEAQAEMPYEGVPNGIYLDRAWAKGAETMAQTVLKILDDVDVADQDK